MPVVLVVGIIAILIGVFVVATGRGGELAYEHADHAPLDLGVISATDVALLRPPTALWGYNMQVTDEALDRIARSVRDRDIEIAFLRRKLADLGQPIIDLPEIGQPVFWSSVTERAIAGPAAGPATAGPTAAGPAEIPAAEPATADPAEIPTARPATAEMPAAEPAAAEIGPAEQTRVEEVTATEEPPDDESVAAAEEQGW